MEKTPQLGIVTMCADKRFHRLVEEKFRELTGLGAESYWIQATAGGAPAIVENGLFTTTDYAYVHGARHMGWAGHGDTCGGYHDVSTEDMEKKTEALMALVKQKYPEATHYQIFSTNEKTEGKKV